MQLFKKNTNKIKVMALGGLNEIGKNMTVVEYKDEIIVIDAGMSFPEDEMLGVDIVIPDINYLVKNKDKYLPFNHKDKILVLGDFASNAHCVGGGSAWVKAYKKVSFIEALNNINVNYLNSEV